MHAFKRLLSVYITVMGSTAWATGTALDPAVNACSTALGQYVEVAGVKVTPAEKAEAEGRVAPVVDKLVEIVKAPYGSLPAVNLGESFSMNQYAADRAARFINNNNLLDRKLSNGNADDATPADQINGSIDELVLHLDQLKGLTSWKVKAVRIASKVPGSRLVLGREPLNKYMTIKQKVIAIGDSIDAGIRLMQSNNEELRRLHTLTVEEAHQMAREIVYIQLLKDQLEARMANDPDFTDPKLRDDFEIQVLSRLERFSMDQKALQATLVASTEAISQQISVNVNVIEGANRLRRVAQPAIAITASVRLTAQDARKEMAKDEMIRRATVDALNEMTKAIKDGNETIAKLAGQSIIPVEELTKNMNELRQARTDHARRMRQVYENARRESQKFDQVMRDGQRLLEEQEVGHKMDLFIGGPAGGSPPPRVR